MASDSSLVVSRSSSFPSRPSSLVACPLLKWCSIILNVPTISDTLHIVAVRFFLDDVVVLCSSAQRSSIGGSFQPFPLSARLLREHRLFTSVVGRIQKPNADLQLIAIPRSQEAVVSLPIVSVPLWCQVDSGASLSVASRRFCEHITRKFITI